MKITAKVSAYRVLNNALDRALEAAFNKHDKYSNEALSENSRSIIATHLSNYFWLEIEENGIEFE